MPAGRVPLERYFAVLEGRELPLYLQAKRFGASFDPSNEEGMWRANGSFTKHMMGHLDDPPGDSGAQPSLLNLKAELARRVLSRCRLCERRCGVDRTKGERGFCGVTEPRVATQFIHFGEEPELVPSYTVFFSGCTFRCSYCQNWDISQDPRAGEVVSAIRISEWISRREGQARNVNWVGGDPTPALPLVLSALQLSSAPLPQVWNSNMYLSEEAMGLLAGTMDVYLADLKYGNDDCAGRLSEAPRYWEVVTRNIRLAGEAGELLVRHLVLPGHVDCCSMPVVEWLAREAPQAKVNVMAQYRPEYIAEGDMLRRPTAKEIGSVRQRARELGLSLTE
jgi:putative pyruvate formate lyase activating enzyme